MEKKKKKTMEGAGVELLSATDHDFRSQGAPKYSLMYRLGTHALVSI